MKKWNIFFIVSPSLNSYLNIFHVFMELRMYWSTEHTLEEDSTYIQEEWWVIFRFPSLVSFTQDLRLLTWPHGFLCTAVVYV